MNGPNRVTAGLPITNLSLPAGLVAINYQIIRDNSDRISSISQLRQLQSCIALEGTIAIVTNPLMVSSLAVTVCTGIAMVDTKNPRVGVIHTSFLDDILPTMEFTYDAMGSNKDDLIIGMTGMYRYTKKAMDEALAIAQKFGRVVFIRLGTCADIAVDYQSRKIYSVNQQRAGIIETPIARF